MNYIKAQFSSLNISIDDKKAFELEKLVVWFETRGTQPLTLNSMMLGIHPIVFTPQDEASLFTVFGTDKKAVQDVIKKCPTIDRTRRVSSDPFNLFCIWLMHQSFIYIQNAKKRQDFMFNVAKYLHYRMFTSLVNHYFQHGAVPAVMEATVNSLSMKFDLIKYGSWRKAIEARAMDLITPGTLHYKTLVSYDNDKQILYVVSDVQTRLREKLKKICEVYYVFHGDNVTIDSQAATRLDNDGEKMIVERRSIYDAVANNVCADVLNVNAFINDATIAMLSRMFSSISPTLLRVALIQLSQLASSQARSRTLDLVKPGKDGIDRIIGVRALVSRLIRVSYRYCEVKRVELSSNAAIWTTLRNAYSSSRISDSGIETIKVNMANFVDSVGRASHKATLSSLRIAITMYIIDRSFKYLP